MATPVKVIPEKCCLLCKNPKRYRLHCLTKHKAVQENYLKIIEKSTDCKLNGTLLHTAYVCEKCLNTCKSYCEFKSNCQLNISKFNETHTRQKRMNKSPHSEEKKGTIPRNKKSRIQLQFDSENDFLDLDKENVFDCEDESTECVSNISDHRYIAGSFSDVCQKNIETEKTVKETLLDIGVPKQSLSIKIGNQLTQMSKSGRSVLFEKNAEGFCEKHWFIEVIQEMKVNCPELLEILLLSAAA